MGNPAIKPRVAAILLATLLILIEVGAMEPTATVDGLALYRTGEGPPVLIMPYPHASGEVTMAETELAEVVKSLGRSVITYDPPGNFRSTREPRVDMPEMLCCALEALAYFGIDNPVDVIGHSMGGFCALGFSIEHQTRVRSLVLIGATSGWPAVSRWGIHRYWRPGQKEWRQLMRWGFRVFVGLGNLEIHKKMDMLIGKASFVDPSHFSAITIEPDDRGKPLPIRASWPAYLRKERLDYAGSLGELSLPVLICVGRHDPQTPVIMSRELNDGIAGSRLVLFDNSGHSPQVEEPAALSETIGRFWTHEIALET